MTKWKWILAARIPARFLWSMKTEIILARLGHLEPLRQLVLLRAGWPAREPHARWRASFFPVHLMLSVAVRYHVHAAGFRRG